MTCLFLLVLLAGFVLLCVVVSFWLCDFLCIGFSILLWNPARLFVRGWLKLFAKTPRQHRNANAIFGWVRCVGCVPVAVASVDGLSGGH